MMATAKLEGENSTMEEEELPEEGGGGVLETAKSCHGDA